MKIEARVVALLLLAALGGCVPERTRPSPTEPPAGDAGPAAPPDAGMPPEAGGGGHDAAVVPDAGPPAEPTFQTFLDDASLGQVRDVWSASPTDVWFVTANGQVLHWTGGTNVDSWSFGVGLNAVYGTSPTDVWVVGEDGTVASFDGDSSFIPVSDRPTYGALLDTWGDTQHRYVAGELYGEIKEATGPSFDAYSTFEVEDGSGGYLSGDTPCVAGSGSGLWVCGDGGLYGYDGSWHHIFGGSGSASGAAPFHVLPIGGDLALALDDEAVTLVTFQHVAGPSGAFGPTSLPIPPGVEAWDGPRLRGVWGNSSEVWVVGTGGYVARLRNYTSIYSDWERIDVGTTADLETIYADDASIWIGGDSIVLRRDR